MPDGSPAPIPQDPSFLEQAFLTNAGDETFLFEGLDGVYYAVRVDGVTPAALRPLEAVRAEVEAAWEEDARANALENRAADVLAQAQANGLEAVSEDLDRTIVVSMPLRRDSFGETIGPQLLQQLFSVPQGSVVSGLAANAEEYVVARIEDISHPVPDLNSDEYNQLGQSMAGQMAQDVIETFASAAREEVGVTTYPNVIDIAMGQGAFY